MNTRLTATGSRLLVTGGVVVVGADVPLFFTYSSADVVRSTVPLVLFVLLNRVVIANTKLL